MHYPNQMPEDIRQRMEGHRHSQAMQGGFSGGESSAAHQHEHALPQSSLGQQGPPTGPPIQPSSAPQM